MNLNPLRHWRIKALLQQTCASMPGGRAVYHGLQRHLGNLRRPDFLRKLSYQRDVVRVLQRHGAIVEGAEVFEIGTGWIPFTPIGLWLCGAKRVISFDVNSYLSLDLTRRALRWMSQHQYDLRELWKETSPPELLVERLDLVAELRDRPADLLRAANIVYRAPADATRTGMPDAAVDIHLSYNVLEHVRLPAIEGMLTEAHRILKPSGIAVHYIDPTDHFSHFDHSLTAIHFLRFDPSEWESLAGNPLAYTNRLRDQDYRALFQHHDFAFREVRFQVDRRSLEALQRGFPLAGPYRDRDAEDLCRRDLVYVATPIAARSPPGAVGSI